jgi:hypothetical protein
VGRGVVVDPAGLTRSGEECLIRLVQLESELTVHTGSPPWLVVAVTTVLEAHTARLFTQLVGLSNVEATNIGKEMYKRLRKDMLSNWSSREHWLFGSLQIPLAGDTAYQNFMVVVELRHALVHGDGNLTEAQLAEFDKMLRLKKDLDRVLSVSCMGSRVTLSTETPERTIAAARSLLVALDGAVLVRYPAMKTAGNP